MAAPTLDLGQQDRDALLQRVRAYPWYAETITGDPIEVFAQKCQETKATDQLLSRFVQQLANGKM